MKFAKLCHQCKGGYGRVCTKTSKFGHHHPCTGCKALQSSYLQHICTRQIWSKCKFVFRPVDTLNRSYYPVALGSVFFKLNIMYTNLHPTSTPHRVYIMSINININVFLFQTVIPWLYLIFSKTFL